MPTLTAPAAGALLALIVGASLGAAMAQMVSPQRTAAPAPQGAGGRLPDHATLDETANAANLWVNQVIGKFLEGPAEDRSPQARPNR